MNSAMKPRLIFDTSALIASAQFSVKGAQIVQYVVTYADVAIPEEVKDEAVDQGLASG
jgi:rRNA-processing protein FCF1